MLELPSIEKRSLVLGSSLFLPSETHPIGMLWSGWPSNSLWLIGLLVGISLISSGISRIMLSLVIRQALVVKRATQ